MYDFKERRQRARGLTVAEVGDEFEALTLLGFLKQLQRHYQYALLQVT
jgi:hypothetical protein